MSYCDYLALLFRKTLLSIQDNVLIPNVGLVQYDLSESGALQSTKKTMLVQDVNGKTYKITIEEY